MSPLWEDLRPCPQLGGCTVYRAWQACAGFSLSPAICYLTVTLCQQVPFHFPLLLLSFLLLYLLLLFSSSCCCSSSSSIFLLFLLFLFPLLLPFFFFLLFLLLFQIFKILFEKWDDREGGAVKEIFHPLAYFLTGCSDWSWARPMPGARNSVRACYVGGRSPRRWAIFYYPLKHISGDLDQKLNSWNLNLHSYVTLALQVVVDTVACCQSLILLLATLCKVIHIIESHVDLGSSCSSVSMCDLVYAPNQVCPLHFGRSEFL